jgi:small-conductance mechanosensitive channel
MADGAKTYSESEHLAILADRVAQETASLSTERAALQGERDELANKLDVIESAKTAAETRATEVAAEFEKFKSEVEQEREAAARKDERITKIRESAKHLKDEFFTDENRIKRIVAMDDAGFEGYLLDLTASALPAGSTSTADVPRQTAMVGSPVEGSTQPGARDFLLRRFQNPTAATKEA